MHIWFQSMPWLSLNTVFKISARLETGLYEDVCHAHVLTQQIAEHSGFGMEQLKLPRMARRQHNCQVAWRCSLSSCEAQCINSTVSLRRLQTSH